MLRTLRQRNFALLWSGGLISMIGDWILVVGLPFEVYRQTGSTLATGGIVLAFLLPSILLGSLGGVFADRWDRRKLMIGVNLLLALAVLPLLAIDTLGLWIAYVVLFVTSSLERVFEPAEGALLPNLLEHPDDDLVTANALNAMNNQLARLIGPVIGGAVVVAGGIVAVAIIDALTFVASAALIGGIRSTRTRAVGESSLEHRALGAWRRLVAEWRAGLRVVSGNRILRAMLVFFVITRIGEGLVATLFVPWVTDALRSDAAGYGAVLSAQAVGGLVGTVVIARLGSRLDPLRLFIGGAVIFGLIDLVLFTYPVIYPNIVPALVGMVIVGVPGAAMGAGIATLQQTLPGDHQRGRVIGAMAAIGALGSLVGAVGAAFLGEVVPVIALLVLQGSGYLVGGLVVARLTRGWRSPEADATG